MLNTTDMKIRYYGHSCFEVHTGGCVLLFDPFIRQNPLASEVDIDQLRPDHILISHGHGDHVADAVEIARKNESKIISNFEIVSWFQNQGVEGHGMNFGGKWEFEFGTVKFVHSTHSSMLPDGSNGGTSGGFVVWNDDTCFYFAGDTGLTMDMKLIPLLCPPLDFAILPIGDNFTMGVEEAVVAADFIKCKKIVGCHFDTFDPIKLDHASATIAFEKAGCELILPTINEWCE